MGMAGGRGNQRIRRLRDGIRLTGAYDAVTASGLAAITI